MASRIETVDSLRGLAALAVAYFHFTNGSQDFPHNQILRLTGEHGNLGVEIFFVISGFILPYAMYRSGYKFKHFFTFVLKRIVRLDPPYLVSIVIVIVLGYASVYAPGFKGESYNISLPQILLHFGYVNVFFGYEWLNPVFWTLAIEFQYYLLIGLMFPVLISRWKWAGFTVLAILAFTIPLPSFVFAWLFLFMLGIITFQFKVKMISQAIYLSLVGLFAIGLYLTLGGWITGAGLSASLFISYVTLRGKVLAFFGSISFSLYLLHTPIGGKVVNLLSRWAHSTVTELLTILAGMIASVIAAYILHRLVEKPAQIWSSRIKYNQSRGVELIDSESL